VVDRFADAGHELGRALADPRPEARRHVVLAADPGDLEPPVGVGHHDEPLTLAEPGRWRPLGEPGDPFDRLAVDAAVLEPAHGPPLHDDVAEVHAGLLDRIAAAPADRVGRLPPDRSSDSIGKTPGGSDPWRSMSL
jgi:hypothetical protein